MSACQRLRLDWRRGNVRNLRAAYERACHVTPRGPHEWRMITAGDRQIRLLIHYPGCRSDHAIFYFHGGGWIVGSPSTHADVSGTLAATTGLPVISIDYRLAPEHKAAAAIADGLALLDHYLGPKGEFASGILAGDSAGGSIALAVASKAAQLGVEVAGAMSFYGAFGIGRGQPGLSRDSLDARSMRRYWLAANASSGESPYSVLALARGLSCPIHLLIAGRDPLRDDSLALAHALRDKGRCVSVDLHAFKGHSFLQATHACRARDMAFHRVSSWVAGLLRQPDPLRQEPA